VAVGLEDHGDLVADIERGLAAVASQLAVQATH
jgi:hypothetical protein